MGAENHLRFTPRHKEIPCAVTDFVNVGPSAWCAQLNCEHISQFHFFSGSGIDTEDSMKKVQVHIRKMQRTRNDAFFANIRKNTI